MLPATCNGSFYFCLLLAPPVLESKSWQQSSSDQSADVEFFPYNLHKPGFSVSSSCNNPSDESANILFLSVLLDVFVNKRDAIMTRWQTQRSNNSEYFLLFTPPSIGFEWIKIKPVLLFQQEKGFPTSWRRRALSIVAAFSFFAADAVGYFISN